MNALWNAVQDFECLLPDTGRNDSSGMGRHVAIRDFNVVAAAVVGIIIVIFIFIVVVIFILIVIFIFIFIVIVTGVVTGIRREAIIIIITL